MKMTLDEFAESVFQSIGKMQKACDDLMEFQLSIICYIKQTATLQASVDPEYGRRLVAQLEVLVEYMKGQRPGSADYILLPQQIMREVQAQLETGRSPKPSLELVVDNTDGGRIDWQPPASAKNKPKPDLKLVWDRDGGGRLDLQDDDDEGKEKEGSDEHLP